MSDRYHDAHALQAPSFIPVKERIVPIGDHSDLSRTTCFRHLIVRLAQECECPDANPDTVIVKACERLRALADLEFQDDEGQE